MKVDTTKSKYAESFYIRQSYVNSEGKSTSKTIRKHGTLNELLLEHGPTRDYVMRWAKEQARIKTDKYTDQKNIKTVSIPLRADKKIDYYEDKHSQGRYLFLQYICYSLGLNRVCRKVRDRHQYEYGLNAILSDLIYTRILNPSGKRSSNKTTCEFLEKPGYELHDAYRALSALPPESDLLQAELYKYSNFLTERNRHILYRLLEKKLEKKYTCSEILETLRKFQFADVAGQGFLPLYKRTMLTDALHCISGIETDFEFITKSKMKEIQKQSKRR